VSDGLSHKTAMLRDASAEIVMRCYATSHVFIKPLLLLLSHDLFAHNFQLDFPCPTVVIQYFMPQQCDLATSGIHKRLVVPIGKCR
jgi:hypothetical protein